MAWTRRLTCTAVALLAALGEPPGSRADASADLALAREDELAELRSTVDVLVDEVARLRAERGVPEERSLESHHGLGPAASRIYGVAGGLSLGGYAEGVYRNRLGDAEGDGDDLADFVRAILYVGYKFTDDLLFNMELEFEHASTSREGSVSVEFAALDWLARPELGVRAGLLLVPMGFVNEIHEPPFFLGTQRPEAERRIIPSTWRENGAGIFGRLGEHVAYRAYVMNGFDASGFSSSGLRGGRQKGSETRAEDLAVVARVDVEDWVPGLLVGGSYYVGNSGQDQRFAQPGTGTVFKLPDSRTRLWEAHVQYRRGPLHLRGLWSEARVGDAGELTQILDDPTDASVKPVAERMVGGYAEIAYDVMPWLRPGSERELSPFFRYEYVDTQADVPGGFARDRGQPRRLFIPGIQYKPHPNVVLKLDYRNIDTWGGNSADEVSVGFGVAY